MPEIPDQTQENLDFNSLKKIVMHNLTTAICLRNASSDFVVANIIGTIRELECHQEKYYYETTITYEVIIDRNAVVWHILVYSIDKQMMDGTLPEYMHTHTYTKSLQNAQIDLDNQIA